MPFDSLPTGTTNKTKQVLEKALSLIERGWTQGTGARDSFGRSVSIDAPDAVTFCAIGALTKVTGANSLRVIHNHRLLLERAGAGTGITNWNDSTKRTKEEVIAVFKKAIELAHLEGG